MRYLTLIGLFSVVFLVSVVSAGINFNSGDTIYVGDTIVLSDPGQFYSYVGMGMVQIDNIYGGSSAFSLSGVQTFTIPDTGYWRDGGSVYIVWSEGGEVATMWLILSAEERPPENSCSSGFVYQGGDMFTMEGTGLYQVNGPNGWPTSIGLSLGSTTLTACPQGAGVYTIITNVVEYTCYYCSPESQLHTNVTIEVQPTPTPLPTYSPLPSKTEIPQNHVVPIVTLQTIPQSLPTLQPQFRANAVYANIVNTTPAFAGILGTFNSAVDSMNGVVMFLVNLVAYFINPMTKVFSNSIELSSSIIGNLYGFSFPVLYSIMRFCDSIPDAIVQLITLGLSLDTFKTVLRVSRIISGVK